MADTTGVQWATHTWNVWRGCDRVSPGCAHCYAEAMSRRNPAVLGRWGKAEEGGTRVVASEAQWRAPARWDNAAVASGTRERVFLGSLMDFCEDRPDLESPRRRAWSVIAACPHLDFLILTKRPENFPRFLPRGWGGGWHNVWLGATAENRRYLTERSEHLRAVPARVRFLSCEPLLEDIAYDLPRRLPGIGWVIVGGESNQGGATARPFDFAWAEGVVTACLALGVLCFVKQLGSRPVAGGLGIRLADRHGGEIGEWPDWLRVRQVPAPAHGG